MIARYGVMTQDGKVIVDDYVSGREVEFPEQEAARRLLAFSAMLAACQLALPHLVNEPAADAVRAAIARATGGQPDA